MEFLDKSPESPDISPRSRAGCQYCNYCNNQTLPNNKFMGTGIDDKNDQNLINTDSTSIYTNIDTVKESLKINSLKE